MTFVLNMALREIRASWQRLVLFFLCIAIGVGAMVSVHSLTDQLIASVQRQARSLMAADVRAETNQPWTADGRALFERFTGSPRVIDYTEIIETETMARVIDSSGSRPVMIQVRAVRDQFPLYGEVRLASGEKYSHRMLDGNAVLASPSLLHRLETHVGASIRIGSGTFTIRGVAERIPGAGLDFRPMPRVLIDYEAVQAAGLTAFGSRVRYVWVFRTLEGQETRFAEELVREARAIKMRVGIGTFRYVENWLTQSLSNFEGFTGLVGIAIMVLGGIGVASVTRVFVQQKVRTIAILKCLGGRNVRVIGAYLVQTIALGLGGSLLGLVLAIIVSVAVTRYAAPLLPLDLRSGLTWRAVIEGVGTSFIITLLFSLPPLLEIRHVKPNSLLRRDALRHRFDWPQLVARIILAASIVVLVVWQAGTYPGTRVFAGGVAATAIVLNFAGTALIAGLRRVSHLPSSFPLRYGLGSLCRPGNQTKVVLFAIGIGTLFILSVRLRLADIQSEFRLDLDGLTSDMFFIDIQSDQQAAAAKALDRLGAHDLRMTPVVRLRLTGVRSGASRPGTNADLQRRRIGGEHRVSYRQALDASETIVAGRFWETTSSSQPEISIEEDQARWWMLEVGDTVQFDLLGRRIEAQVTSIRRLDRRVRSMSPLAQFNILFRPGTLESAPHMFIGALKGPPAGVDRARMQNAFVEEFPNVTMVDALDEIQEVRNRIGDLSLALSILGGFVTACGLLILVGSITVTKFQRVYEAAVLKTIGAKKGVLLRVALIEYGILGLLAGGIGSTSSIVLTWAMTAVRAARVPWTPHPLVNVVGLLLTVVLVAGVGLAASWTVITRKPLTTLREE